MLTRDTDFYRILSARQSGSTFAVISLDTLLVLSMTESSGKRRLQSGVVQWLDIRCILSGKFSGLKRMSIVLEQCRFLQCDRRIGVPASVRRCSC